MLSLNTEVNKGITDENRDGSDDDPDLRMPYRKRKRFHHILPETPGPAKWREAMRRTFPDMDRLPESAREVIETRFKVEFYIKLGQDSKIPRTATSGSIDTSVLFGTLPADLPASFIEQADAQVSLTFPSSSLLESNFPPLLPVPPLAPLSPQSPISSPPSASLEPLPPLVIPNFNFSSCYSPYEQPLLTCTRLQELEDNFINAKVEPFLQTVSSPYSNEDEPPHKLSRYTNPTATDYDCFIKPLKPISKPYKDRSLEVLKERLSTSFKEVFTDPITKSSKPYKDKLSKISRERPSTSFNENPTGHPILKSFKPYKEKFQEKQTEKPSSSKDTTIGELKSGEIPSTFSKETFIPSSSTSKPFIKELSPERERLITSFRETSIGDPILRNALNSYSHKYSRAKEREKKLLSTNSKAKFIDNPFCNVLPTSSSGSDAVEPPSKKLKRKELLAEPPSDPLKNIAIIQPYRESSTHSQKHSSREIKGRHVVPNPFFEPIEEFSRYRQTNIQTENPFLRKPLTLESFFSPAIATRSVPKLAKSSSLYVDYPSEFPTSDYVYIKEEITDNNNDVTIDDLNYYFENTDINVNRNNEDPDGPIDYSLNYPPNF